MTPADASANPALGVLIFALGGLAGAVFYLPFRKVQELGVGELLARLRGDRPAGRARWCSRLRTSPNVFAVLQAAPRGELLYCFLCGAMWGVGGLTWGLMIRYLGVGLGLAIGCGITSAAGTLVPRILAGDIGRLFEPGAGIVSLARRGRLARRHRHRRPGRHVQGERAAGGREEEVGGRVQLQQGHPRGALLRPDEFGHGLRAGRRADDPVAGRDDRAGHLADVERHAGARRRAARRVHREPGLVPVPQRRRTGRPAITRRPARRWPATSLFAGHRGRHLVLAVHLLQDGRAGDGPDGLRRLGGADGLPDPLQLADRRVLPRRVARDRPPDAHAARRWPGAPDSHGGALGVQRIPRLA